MGRTDTEPSFLRGFAKVSYEGNQGEWIRRAYLEAFEDFIYKHGRLPNMDILTFQGGFSTTSLVFEISEEVRED